MEIKPTLKDGNSRYCIEKNIDVFQAVVNNGVEFVTIYHLSC